MKNLILAGAIALGITGICFAEEGNLLIDDFEVQVSGGPEGTVDFGAGNGSSIELTGSSEIKNSGDQALKAAYDAVSGGYMYISRGSGLDAKNARWLVNPWDIKWEGYGAISFYVYGTGSKAKIAFDIRDKGMEMWRFIIEDDSAGWKKFVAGFDKFTARDDWQPAAADKNGQLDFPIKAYQFEPLPEAKGILYFDTVELVKK